MKELKKESFGLIVEQGRHISELSREFGVSTNILRNWVRPSKANKVEPFPGKGRFSPQGEELCPLRRENRRLRMERDILKKAVAIFSEEPQCNTVSYVITEDHLHRIAIGWAHGPMDQQVVSH